MKGQKCMRVRARIDKCFDTMEIQVCSNELTPQVKALVEDISAFVNDGISGTDFRGEKIMIFQRDIQITFIFLSHFALRYFFSTAQLRSVLERGEKAQRCILIIFSIALFA